MNPSTKRKSLLFLSVALISLVLLSGSLSGLQLHAGMPFPTGGNSNSDSQPVSHVAPANLYLSPILKALFALIFLVLVIEVPVRLIALVSIKRVFQFLLVMILLFLLASLISHLPGTQPAHLPQSASPVLTPAPFDYPVSPLGEPPQDLIRLVLIAFVFGAALLVIRILKQRQSVSKIEDQLSQEAEAAVNAIQLGENLRNVIARCYLQMTHLLQEEQNIERSDSMTVREFEDWLEFKGFPAVPIHKLSHLFEKTRYSQESMDKEDETAALESLNEIIRFCQRRRD